MDNSQLQRTDADPNQNEDKSADEIASLRESIRLDDIAPGRYSLLLLLSLFGGWKSGKLDPHKVVHEIKLLENFEPSDFKPPIQNRHPPLKGLWHKHYREQGLASFAMNVQKGLNKYGMPYFDQKVADAEADGVARDVTAEEVPALVADIVDGNLKRLKEAEAMTGEWILFAKHEGKNYYLTIATHDTNSHDRVRKNIDACCCMEFPFLKQQLESA